MSTEEFPLPVARTVSALRQQVAQWRKADKKIALVPTMGALHAGHISLVDIGHQHADHVVASIFVNPTQFGPNEDFDKYPRQKQADAALLADAGCGLLFAPDVAEMYPDGFATSVSVSGITDGLCGAHRPGHFDGMATVVAKLLLQCLPDMAIFGEKDYQQLMTIRRLTADLNIPVEIIGAPTMRDADGLATSSRNKYLSVGQRQVALALPTIMQKIIAHLPGNPNDVAQCLERGKSDLIAAGFDSVDYLELRDAENLQAMNSLAAPARLLAAAYLGDTRLIDNMPVTPAGGGEKS